MSATLEQDWHTLRHQILIEAAGLACVHEPYLQAFLGALTRAFDRPVPPYTIYRQLSRFKAAHWPLLCSQLENQTPVDAPKLAAVVARARDMLELADRKRDEADNEALEIELEVLKKLLDRSA